jgi:putative copper resistance protein D
MEVTFPQIVSTVLVNLSMAWIAGVLASKIWLLSRTSSWQNQAVMRLSPAMMVGLTAGTIGTLLSLWTESAVMGDVPWLQAGPVLKEVLTSTHYGHAGVVAVSLTALAMLAHWFLRRTNAEVGYVGTLTVLLLLVAATRVTIGHAFEQGPFSTAVWVEWLHLLFMSLWVGIVFVAGWLVLPEMLVNEFAPTKERADYLTFMSNWAAAALAGILATGAYNVYRVLGNMRDLLNSDYGHILLFKLFFVVVAIALGGYNKFYGLTAALSSEAEAMKAERSLRTIIVVLRLESAALLLVLVAAAVLTNSSPPG